MMPLAKVVSGKCDGKLTWKKKDVELWDLVQKNRDSYYLSVLKLKG